MTPARRNLNARSDHCYERVTLHPHRPTVNSSTWVSVRRPPQDFKMVGTGNKDELYDISDSTDWLDTPLASLAPIDASLRCQVCKDFYKTPMITSCSHTFCSLCIRRCLANDGKCPACRTTEQENKLRSNWAIEGLVDEFTKARPTLLDLSRKQPSFSVPLSPKRKVDEAELDDQSPDQRRKKTRASSRLSARPQGRNDVVVLDIEDDGDDDYKPGIFSSMQLQGGKLIRE
jgi:E3 ubiquitin-protein ligase RAD18